MWKHFILYEARITQASLSGEVTDEHVQGIRDDSNPLTITIVSTEKILIWQFHGSNAHHIYIHEDLLG